MNCCKIKSYVSRDEMLKITDTYSAKKKWGNIEILSTEETFIPYYVFKTNVKIKRAFGLKPKVLEHIYWVNAVDGSMLRTADLPEIMRNESEIVLKSRIDESQCRKLCYENDLQHTLRFYKSFWVPEIEVQRKEKVSIPFWNVILKSSKDGNNKKIHVNCFSGDIKEEKNVCN